MYPGDLNKFFERIVADEQYDTNVLSSPDTTNGPWVVTIDDFISHEETQVLIEMGAQLGYERSEDVCMKQLVLWCIWCVAFFVVLNKRETV
jgi:hypothetical protein